MIRLFLRLTTLALIGSSSLATAGEDPWIVYFPTSVSDVCSGFSYDASPGDSSIGDDVLKFSPLSRSPNAYDSALVVERTPYLLRPTQAHGKPLPLTPWIQRGLDPEYTVFRESPRLGMFAVSTDSCWQESDAVDPSLKPFWHDAPDSLARRACTPTVILVDTTGLRRATFFGARSPTWSPDGSLLAFRTVRANWVRLNGRTIIYPESADSIVVVAPESGSRDVFPVPSNVISWADNEYITLENQGRLCGLNLHTRESYSRPAWEAMVGEWSPDQRYSLRVTRRSLKVYGMSEKREISSEVVKALGTGYPHFSGRSFWVAGEQRQHDLCLGISWLTPGRYGNLVTKYRGCEVVVVDVQTGAVKLREKGAFVGPVPDRTQAVVWQDGHLRFIPL